MEIELQKHKINIEAKSFVMMSHAWLFDEKLAPIDVMRLGRLYWRYDFFRDNAIKSGIKHPATNCMYDTQENYAELLDLHKSKIPALFKKLEDCGYLVRIKSGKQVCKDGVFEMLPRDYVIVLNPAHSRYASDLDDVWVALSQRLTSMENKSKTGQKTYRQMLASYTRLFNDKVRYKREGDTLFVPPPEIEVGEPPLFEEIPKEFYMEEQEVVMSEALQPTEVDSAPDWLVDWEEPVQPDNCEDWDGDMDTVPF